MPGSGLSPHRRRGSKRTRRGQLKQHGAVWPAAPPPSSSESEEDDSSWCNSSSSSSSSEWDARAGAQSRYKRRAHAAVRGAPDAAQVLFTARRSTRPSDYAKPRVQPPSPLRQRAGRERVREPEKPAHRLVQQTLFGGNWSLRPAWEPPPAGSPARHRGAFARSPHSRRLRRTKASPAGKRLAPSPVRREHAPGGNARRARALGCSPLRGTPLRFAQPKPPARDPLWSDSSELSSLSDEASASPTPAPAAPAPGSPPRVAAPEEVPAAPWSQQTLLRRRRPSLLALCRERQLPVASDSTKAVLVDALLGRAAPAETEELNGLDLERLNLLDHEIPPEKLEKLERIGTGGYKDVYVGKYHISRTRVNKVAIADIRDQLTEMDIKELGFLRDLRHENIVRFIGVSIPAEPRTVPCMIVSELCSNGDLFDYIRNTPPPADVEIFRIMLEIARGLEYLHLRTPTIVHRDCKSSNVLITKDRTAKISDFGLARVKRSNRAMIRSLVGTVNWQAVELWAPKPNYNEKVDVWSAAMTFWEALQWYQPEKRYPFQGMNEHEIYLNVGQKQLRPFTGTIRRRYGGEIVELLDRMWAHLPRDRPSMTDVCAELERLIALKRGAA